MSSFPVSADKYTEEPRRNGTQNRDAHIDISISEDSMKASGRVYPALGEGRQLDRDTLEQVLEKAGISEGIDWPGILAFLASPQKGGPPVSLSIASGTPADDADPPYLKLSNKLFSLKLYGKEQGGRVDYREARPFVVVKKDEALGRYIPAGEGTPGVTVTGQTIAPGLKSRIPFEPGENTYRDGDIVRSSVTGRFFFKGKIFLVTEILELSGVDFHTGNIRYPGDVLLKGEVCDGFTLSCGGDLYSSEPLNVTAIQVKGDLKVEGGIIGRTPGTLKVGGTVQARFIENLELECRGDLIVEGGILHSRIHTLGKVVCGEKGKIFNSDIHAVEGLEAKQLGNPAGQLTQIHCGCDFREVRRYRAIKEQEKQFLARLQEKKTASRNSAMSDEEALELRRELHELAERAEEAMGRMDIRPEAHVMVRDTIYPGVSIEICRVLYRVDKSIPRGTFFLDTESREIRVSDS